MTVQAGGFPGSVARAPSNELVLRLITTTDHKVIGILYLVTTMVFFLIGGVEAMMMRIQLALPRNDFLGPAAYDAIFTMHGTTMIFLVVMPMLLGFVNYLVPLMIGARDMSFPRLNALSYWLLLFGGIVLHFSFLAGDPPAIGWFAYAPLTERQFTPGPSVDYWIIGLLLTSIGSIATGLNTIVTVVKLRAPGMTAFRMPVFVWMAAVTAFLIIWAIPALTAAQFMLLFDRHLGTGFFDVHGGGDAVLWQHLFWYFGHPEVYIMALPAFGIISEVIPVFSRKPIFGYAFIVASGIAIGALSFGVWAHHMFAVGLGFSADAFFSASSMLIAVPTGVKVFSWIATMVGGRIRFQTPMLFATGFLILFTIGGISGVHFATVPIDWQTTDTYYVVAHFHYVLFGGTLFAILAGAYYWFPKFSGRMLDERLGTLNFWLTFVGMNLTFFPMHFLGLMGMPRRVYTYPDLPGWALWNMVATIGAVIIGLSVLVFAWNLLVSLKKGRIAGENPWDAWTLEWATTSPPPPQNFIAPLPPIASPRPLWDQTHPDTRNGHVTAEVRTETGFAHLPTPVLGTVVFISSEVIFFGALISAYIVNRGNVSSGPGSHDLDFMRTALFSLALFASSGTVVLAEKQLARGQYGAARLWFGATIALGATFLAGQLTEYQHLFAEGVTWGTSLFTAAFFTLTGFHGLHVVVGLIALIVLLALLTAGDFRNGQHHAAISAISIYWHFVDVVWVVVFSLVYIWGLIS